jgi:hypothetical protein
VSLGLVEPAAVATGSQVERARRAAVRTVWAVVVVVLAGQITRHAPVATVVTVL